MRIVAGTWAGQALLSPGGRVRPTSEELRAALMDLLGPALRGASVAGLFAGTGALGLEALSRGARRCDFVENGPAALHALKANVAAFRVKTRTRIFVRDAIPYVEHLGPAAYDVVFADPPYGSRKLDRIVDQWLRVPFCAVLALEHSPEHELPVRGVQRRIRDTVVTVLRRREA
ncbi:MAG: 16S rRNA (guanine(966)-N(2))-methyltransferase RsmD [Gemmatimonadetes bacterium]|nr:16S rRNA (guanine(966)-N(2))-methyltransferase RsmD [Gemmatimonadota bacterium]